MASGTKSFLLELECQPARINKQSTSGVEHGSRSVFLSQSLGRLAAPDDGELA
jgi:hypothetical protein